MELVLNLAWLVISVSLVLIWGSEFRRATEYDKRPSTTAQLMALAMLIVILLPVISMTDDLQAMSTAEIEHVTRRADLLPNADQPADVVTPVDARLFPSRYLINLQSSTRVEVFNENAQPQSGSVRPMSNRPPPCAA